MHVHVIKSKWNVPRKLAWWPNSTLVRQETTRTARPHGSQDEHKKPPRARQIRGPRASSSCAACELPRLRWPNDHYSTGFHDSGGAGPASVLYLSPTEGSRHGGVIDRHRRARPRIFLAAALAERFRRVWVWGHRSAAVRGQSSVSFFSPEVGSMDGDGLCDLALSLWRRVRGIAHDGRRAEQRTAAENDGTFNSHCF